MNLCVVCIQCAMSVVLQKYKIIVERTTHDITSSALNVFFDVGCRTNTRVL